MKLAFLLFEYFPYGGLQRDMVAIATKALERGHQVTVLTRAWHGDPAPVEGLEVRTLPSAARSNHASDADFARRVTALLDGFDRVVGFNKMPGLDVYYAADPCFEDKAQTLRNPLYRISSRYRHFAEYERAVFSPAGKTQILMISEVQQPLFTKHYKTPLDRFHLLPPGIAPDRRAPANATEIRADFRAEFGLADDELLLVQIGSGFITKGVDRSIRALAALPADLRKRTRLMVIGQDDPGTFQRIARSLAVDDRVIFMKGRSDVPRFLLGADLLIHPAYNENTGTVLLEALVAGLPVLVTDVCGYAHYISEADCGLVVPSPFKQSQLDQMLSDMLSNSALRKEWKANALRFADQADLYSLPERAADVILGAGA